MTERSRRARRLTRAGLIVAGGLLAGAFAPAAPARADLPAPAAPTFGELGVHVVQPGESLFTIAARYDMRSLELARLNGTRPGAPLLPGRRLWVPLAKALPAAGDAGTAGSRAAAADLPAGELTEMGDLPPEPVDLAREAATRGTHLVQAGDTLSGIAARYGLSAGHLMRLNSLGDADVLQPGQSLVVPVPGAGAAAAAAPGIPGAGGEKRIEIDVSDQRMYVWQGDTLVWNLVASTGMSGYPTRRGTFAVQSKIDNAWSTAWQLWMPNWLGIYWAGGSENGIHALPLINGQPLWGGYLGTPISYGCIVLDTADAALLYDWAELGTKVVIRD